MVFVPTSNDLCAFQQAKATLCHAIGAENGDTLLGLTVIGGRANLREFPDAASTLDAIVVQYIKQEIKKEEAREKIWAVRLDTRIPKEKTPVLPDSSSDEETDDDE